MASDELRERLARARAAIERVLQRNATIGTLCEADEYELQRALRDINCTCPWSQREGYSVRGHDPACTEHSRSALARSLDGEQTTEAADA